MNKEIVEKLKFCENGKPDIFGWYLVKCQNSSRIVYEKVWYNAGWHWGHCTRCAKSYIGYKVLAWVNWSSLEKLLAILEKEQDVCETCGGSGVASSPDDIDKEVCTNSPCPSCKDTGKRDKPESGGFIRPKYIDDGKDIARVEYLGRIMTPEEGVDLLNNIIDRQAKEIFSLQKENNLWKLRIEEAGKTVEQQQVEIEELKKLLNLYRKKRSVDGGDGRIYDAHEYLKTDKQIDELENKETEK